MADCARCLTRRQSTYLVSFTYEDVVYEVDLCDAHLELFDRDMHGWTSIAKVAGQSAPVALVPMLAAAPKPGPPPAKFLVPVTDGGEDVVYDNRVPTAVPGEISAEAMSYGFTEHARFRMATRGLTVADIYRTITSPVVVREGKEPGQKIFVSADGYKVYARPSTKLVITVADMNDHTKEQIGG